MLDILVMVCTFLGTFGAGFGAGYSLAKKKFFWDRIDCWSKR